jgi:hypothetical protein
MITNTRRVAEHTRDDPGKLRLGNDSVISGSIMPRLTGRMLNVELVSMNKFFQRLVCQRSYHEVPDRYYASQKMLFASFVEA